ncbi:hypothetical protein [Streptomyces sp. NPDC001480]|uniref:hypothetical protein n=1 Tax=Streptomyces sp. NPDC001480 TaxID=3364577 RepID=UPI0036993645
MADAEGFGVVRAEADGSPPPEGGLAADRGLPPLCVAGAEGFGVVRAEADDSRPPEEGPAADAVRPASATTSEAASAIDRTGRRRGRPACGRRWAGEVDPECTSDGEVGSRASSAGLLWLADAADAAALVVWWGVGARRAPDGRGRCRAATARIHRRCNSTRSSEEALQSAANRSILPKSRGTASPAQ